MPILGWIVVAWFSGMIVADVLPSRMAQRQSGDYIYQYKTTGNEKEIVKYRAFGMSTCRPQCYMSGTFFDGVVRGMAPWPFRQGKYFECPREGELDYCTGEVFQDGHWFPTEGTVKDLSNDVINSASLKENLK